ncbi:protein toll-like [Papilio machaon]|uniref:protein toll-like n=1 Tax=Papilio machaon TaxID=76193 RepID=UPI001E665EAF|nr:protein toll-like [Papilio machaon]
MCVCVQASDLQWSRDVAAEVLLQDNPLRRVTLSRTEHDTALAAPPTSHVTKFKSDATFECDCLLYWAARLVRERPDLPIRQARCSDGRDLLRVPLPDLVCVLDPPHCAPRCRCALLGQDLRVDCAGAGLAHPPRPPPDTPPPAQLLLANNSIATLRPDDFGPELRLLDLSHNLISELDAETAAALLAPAERSVLLARNPLACRCGDALPAALHAHSARVPDFGELRCADGRRLAELRPGEPCLTPTSLAALGAAGGALLLAAAALGAGLVRRPVRLALKRFLLERGLCLRWAMREAAAPDDRRYRYDVFVSFSHRDERFVTERLVPGLEEGPRAYRLCLHYRDWAPGEWIPAQIARSVRESRRTLLVVSSEWARSTWAQAEFRAAYALALADARPRLVLLLLEDPAALRDLDPDVRAFLDANTYLRWDDPWFWRKLRHALPRGNTSTRSEDGAPPDPAAHAPVAPPATTAPPAPTAPTAPTAPPAPTAAPHTAPVA